jgi:murein L,D-transpeptidase YafK
MARLALIACLLAFGPLAHAVEPSPENQLSAVFEAIEANQPDLAMQRVDALIHDHPNFRLAHLVRGDLLLARSRPLQTFGNVAKTVPQERIDDLREEALARIRAQRQRPADDMLPRLVLQLDASQKYALLVDSRHSRLYVFANENGLPHLVADFYVTLGKNGMEKTREGDQKTPIGVYYVTANLPRQKLSDFYGAGAFPISYPNEWDRSKGRNGHGIWLHGTPSALYSRPPRASDGCIVLANPDLLTLGGRLQVGLTPVIIADEIEWSDAASVESDRRSLADAIEGWRADWESRDTERYLGHYSERFTSGGQDLAAWQAHKRNVNQGKTWVKVGLSRVSMFRYPREGDFVVVNFEQSYRSNNLSNAMRKRQYWIKESGRWKILYEGSA